MNSINILGRLTKDPELSKTNTTQKSVLNFDIAVESGHSDPFYFSVQAWEKLAENTSKYCQKGTKVAVTGRLIQEKYNDREGKPRVATKILALDIDFLTHSQGTGTNQNHEGVKEGLESAHGAFDPFAGMNISSMADPFGGIGMGNDQGVQDPFAGLGNQAPTSDSFSDPFAGLGDSTDPFAGLGFPGPTNDPFEK
ncbi:single-strand DNA-binding protein [Brevibacillus sp. IT-7CA2]|uniref:single-stranded DNA-binding protein n=1 Tax=Brevibacillus sp. IT-7CA2 TaxID=3026436 RepID=UPI0039DF5809